MSQLYEAVQQIESIIERDGMDLYKTKGLISMHAGFLLSFVGPDFPDDPDKIAKLREVCMDVLGEPAGL